MIADRHIHKPSGRTGYTLLEVMVVLLLLSVSAAVVAPSLLWTAPDTASEMQALVNHAREASVRRGITVHLRIEQSGAWQAFSGSPPERDLLTSGRLGHSVPSRIDLVFSPLGSCAPSAESGPANALSAYDALTCRERPS